MAYSLDTQIEIIIHGRTGTLRTLELNETQKMVQDLTDEEMSILRTYTSSFTTLERLNNISKTHSDLQFAVICQVKQNIKGHIFPEIYTFFAENGADIYHGPKIAGGILAKPSILGTIGRNGIQYRFTIEELAEALKKGTKSLADMVDFPVEDLAKKLEKAFFHADICPSTFHIKRSPAGVWSLVNYQVKQDPQLYRMYNYDDKFEEVLKRLFPNKTLYVIEDERGTIETYLDSKGNEYFLHWDWLPFATLTDWGFPRDWNWLSSELDLDDYFPITYDYDPSDEEAKSASTNSYSFNESLVSDVPNGRIDLQVAIHGTADSLKKINFRDAEEILWRNKYNYINKSSLSRGIELYKASQATLSGLPADMLTTLTAEICDATPIDLNCLNIVSHFHPELKFAILMSTCFDESDISSTNWYTTYYAENGGMAYSGIRGWRVRPHMLAVTDYKDRVHRFTLDELAHKLKYSAKKQNVVLDSVFGLSTKRYNIQSELAEAINYPRESSLFHIKLSPKRTWSLAAYQSKQKRKKCSLYTREQYETLVKLVLPNEEFCIKDAHGAFFLDIENNRFYLDWDWLAYGLYLKEEYETLLKLIFSNKELYVIKNKRGKACFLDIEGNEYFLHWDWFGLGTHTDWGFPDEWKWIPFNFDIPYQIKPFIEADYDLE